MFCLPWNASHGVARKEVGEKHARNLNNHFFALLRSLNFTLKSMWTFRRIVSKKVTWPVWSFGWMTLRDCRRKFNSEIFSIQWAYLKSNCWRTEERIWSWGQCWTKDWTITPVRTIIKKEQLKRKKLKRKVKKKIRRNESWREKTGKEWRWFGSKPCCLNPSSPVRVEKEQGGESQNMCQ